MFAIGVARNQDVIASFFDQLKGEVNSFIQENTYVVSRDVTISFGCKIFSGERFDASATILVSLVKQKRVQDASRAYLDLMLGIRQELAYELDRAKFASLSAEELELVILFRNVVYAQLQRYKQVTRKSLVSLASRVDQDPILHARVKVMALNTEYGISDTDGQSILDLLTEM